MAMATVIWAAAAEVIIMDGAADAVIIIVTIADTPAGEHVRCSPAQSACCGTVQFRGSRTDNRSCQ
jgi:hypothetical protein